MGHYGPSPASICDGLLQALEAFKAAGKVRTVKRLAGELQDEAALDRLLTGGVPALLVSYLGGPFQRHGTHGHCFMHERRFIVLCCTGSFQDQRSRFVAAPNGTPGVEQLLDWTTYVCLRVLLAHPRLRLVKVNEQRPLRHETGKYVYLVEFSAVCDVDFWDDTPAAELNKLGIVHQPTSFAHLWHEDDPEKPLSALPHSLDGGVGQL